MWTDMIREVPSNIVISLDFLFQAFEQTTTIDRKRRFFTLFAEQLAAQFRSRQLTVRSFRLICSRQLAVNSSWWPNASMC